MHAKLANLSPAGCGRQKNGPKGVHVPIAGTSLSRSVARAEGITCVGPTVATWSFPVAEGDRGGPRDAA